MLKGITPTVTIRAMTSREDFQNRKLAMLLAEPGFRNRFERAGTPIRRLSCPVSQLAWLRDTERFTKMATTATKLKAVEAYFTGLQLIRSSGGATDERSLYVPLANLLNAVGGTRSRKCSVQDMADQGVGHPDFGLYTTQQVQKGKPKSGQKPERGVIEVKPIANDAWLTAASDQVAGYWLGLPAGVGHQRPRLRLCGRGPAGHPVRLESLRLSDSSAQFDAKLEHPRAFANEVGPGLGGT